MCNVTFLLNPKEQAVLRRGQSQVENLVLGCIDLELGPTITVCVASGKALRSPHLTIL